MVKTRSQEHDRTDVDESQNEPEKSDPSPFSKVNSLSPFSKHAFDDSYHNAKASEGTSDSSSRHRGYASSVSEAQKEAMLEVIEIELRQLELRKQKLQLNGGGTLHGNPARFVPSEPTIPRASDSGHEDAAAFGHNSTQELQKVDVIRAAKSVLASSTLPKIEIDKFDGSPLEFWRFMKSFQMSVADIVEDDQQRLMYLIHYCCGAAKEAIRHCVLLPGRQGYAQAIKILKTQFGRPHAISETFLAELLDGKNIASDDLDGLRKLVRCMISSEMALSQMNHSADLNCSTNLKRIVQRLPRHLQLKWAEVADDILNEGFEPTFRNLMEFLEKRLSVASNCYGQVASVSKRVSYSRERLSHPESSAPRHFVNTTTHFEATACPVCSKAHQVVSCSKFAAMSHTDKLQTIKRNKLCFNCLKPNHRSIDCRSQTRCEEVGCGRRHHKLIHEHRTDPAPCATDVCIHSTSVAKSASYLGFVPVRIVGPKGSVDTYALLDNGSDATLLLRDVAERTGLNGRRTQLQVSSIGGNVSTDSLEISFDVRSISDDYCLPIDKAYTVDHLPISRDRVPSRECLSQWPHLHDIELPMSTSDRVSLLIGTNVPEAHWVLEQRIGTPRQPCATLTVLGWVLFGPAANQSQTNTVPGFEARLTAMENEESNKDHLLSKTQDLLSNKREQRSRLQEQLQRQTRHLETMEKSSEKESQEVNQTNEITRHLQREVKGHQTKAKLLGQLVAKQERLLSSKETELYELQIELQRTKSDLKGARETTASLNSQLQMKSEELSEAQQAIKINEHIIDCLNRQVSETQMGQMQQRLRSSGFSSPVPPSTNGSSYPLSPTFGTSADWQSSTSSRLTNGDNNVIPQDVSDRLPTYPASALSMRPQSNASQTGSSQPVPHNLYSDRIESEVTKRQRQAPAPFRKKVIVPSKSNPYPRLISPNRLEPRARNQWPKGIGTSETPGVDGLVRKVSIRTSREVIDRDISKVCLLEGANEN